MYGSERFEQIWWLFEVFEFFPLTYNEKVINMTWPEVNDIQKIKYTSRNSEVLRGRYINFWKL